MTTTEKILRRASAFTGAEGRMLVVGGKNVALAMGDRHERWRRKEAGNQHRYREVQQIL